MKTVNTPRRKHAFLWIVIITLVSLISTTVIHEMGHVILAWSAGCNADTVVLDVAKVTIHTQVKCPGPIQYVVILGGLLLSLGFGMIFLTIKDLPEGDLFFVITGISLILAYKDLVLIEGWIAVMSFISGFIILLLGEIIYAGAYMNLDPRILGPLMKFRIYREEGIEYEKRYQVPYNQKI